MSNKETESWSEWTEGYNTFVINANENGDIMHIKPNGNRATYRKLSETKEEYTEKGKHYQIIKALDEDGDIFSFQLFDDTSIGLKMIYGNIMIQFAKK